jgi:hypothetical protein
MTDPIHAPWTPEQVAALNAFQHHGGMHPFTCPADHPGERILTAHPDGWHCPDSRCRYWQDWAHAFMADPETWPTPPAAEPDIDHALAFGEPVALQLAALPNNGEQPRRTTPDNSATSSDTPDNPLRDVIDLYERWLAAGPPPIGTLMARWWDRRLAELRTAILPAGGQPAQTATQATEPQEQP